MNIHLSAIGYVADVPRGNRLRWTYPCAAAVDRRPLGLPQGIVVERAPVPLDLPAKPSETWPAAMSDLAPTNWWDHYGSITLSNVLPIQPFSFPSPVQAVRFVYKGYAARFQARNRERKRPVCDRILHYGDTVHLEETIHEMVFYSPYAVLENLRALDLFKDRGLQWERIATLGVLATGRAAMQDVVLRYPARTTMTERMWEELTEVAAEAQTGRTPKPDPAGPTIWQAFDMALGVRWEYSLLYGFGFCDGPSRRTCSLDKVVADKLLNQPPLQPVAYRISEARPARVGPSNLVICPPWAAPSLLTPSVPVYVEPKARLKEGGGFEASLRLQWHQADPRALGVEIEQDTSASPSLGGSAAATETFLCRSSVASDQPLEGETYKVFDVPFHDVTLRARARTVDGWDRASSFTAPATTVLELHHTPPAPPLRAAIWVDGKATIERQAGDADLPDWQPDIVVATAAAHNLAGLNVYRKASNAPPPLATVTVTEPVLVEEKKYKTTVSGPVGVNLQDFVHGYLIAGELKTTITSVAGQDVYFALDDEGGSAYTLFSAGAAKLQQDPKSEMLWTKVAEFDVLNLPAKLEFPDALPLPAGQADVLSYVVRLAYLGRLGPASNVVQATRTPATPVAPPPFQVEVLGIDFYNRTSVQIHLTQSQPGPFTVWWADGEVDATSFNDKAVAGIYGAQRAHQNQYLYDILSLPIPTKVKHKVTIGLQAVNDAGGQSQFVILPVELEPLSTE